MPTLALAAPRALRLSPTFLERAACPLCLKWTYLDKDVPRSVRPTTLRGIVAHHAIALLTDTCLKARLLPAQLSDEQLRRAIAAASPHAVFAELGKVFEWLSLWRERFQLQPEHLVGFEERMALDERFGEVAWSEAAYRGIVDVIHLFGRTAVVTDYKSRPNVLSPSALAEHEQGTFYAWLVAKFYPQVEDVVFRLFYLRFGFYSETRRTRQQLAAFEQVLLLKREMIAAIDDWSPVAGRHCGVCDFVPRCPLVANGDGPLVQIRTRDEAVRVASELRVKEEWVKEARSQLKAYVERNDDVELEGYAYGFRAPSANGRTAFRGYTLAGDERAASSTGEEDEPT